MLCMVACAASGVKGELKLNIYVKILSQEGCSVFFIENIKLEFLHSNFITPPAGADGTEGRSTALDVVQSTYLREMMLLKSVRYIVNRGFIVVVFGIFLHRH